jgi:hypothetical protein
VGSNGKAGGQVKKESARNILSTLNIVKRKCRVLAAAASPLARSSLVGVVLLLSLIVAVAPVPRQAIAQSSTTVSGIGSWTEMTDYGAASGTTGSGGIQILGVSCVVYQNDVYCVGGQTLAAFGNSPPGTDLSNVYYAAISSNGALSGWTETTDYGASSGSTGSGGVGIEWPSCVQYNGYIYCVAGASTGGNIVSKVFYAQLSSSGVGPWTETTDYGAASGTTGSGGDPTFQLSCVADGGYIYCAGGFDDTSQVFYAQLSSTGVGPWKETTDYGAASGTTGSGGVAISSAACVDSGGYMYCIGGNTKATSGPSSYVFYAPLSSSGVGAWTQTTDFGATSGATGKGGLPIYGTTCAAYSGNIICIDGDTTGGSGTNAIGFAKDQGISYWDLVEEFPEVTYWMSCEEYYGGGLEAFLICYGGGSSQGYTAQIETGSTTTTTTTTATTTTPTVAKTTPTLTTQVMMTSGILPNQPGQPVAEHGEVPQYSEVYDTAMLTGTSSNPTGNITYTFYDGGACQSQFQISTATQVVNIAGASPGYPTNKGYASSLGSYSIMAVYSGDSLNGMATSTCEVYTVEPVSAFSSTTTTGTGVGVGGGFPWSWIGIGIGILLLLLLLAWLFIWRKRPKVPPPVVPEEGTEPGTEEGEACKPENQWFLQDFTLSAAIGEKWNPTGSTTVPEQHMVVTKPAGEPMPMSSQALDRHTFLYGCTCEQNVDQKLIHVYAVVRYEWEISSGGGSFVRITGGPGKSTELGNQVIYEPPEIADGDSVEVRILAKAKHYDDTKFPDHPELVISVNVKVKRIGENYVWEWWPTETTSTKGPGFNVIHHPGAPCTANGEWHSVKPIEGLIGATLFAPGSSGPPLERQSGECSPGDYVRLEFKGQDYDQFTITCTPPTALAIGTPLPGQIAKAQQNPSTGGKCLPSKGFVTMLDPLYVNWVSTDGYFVGTENTVNQLVAIWRAPQHEGVVEISVSIDDSGLEFDDKELNLGTKITVRKK